MPQAPPEPLYILRGHRAAVQCVAFTPDCKHLAAGDAEGQLKVWDLGSQRPTTSIRAHQSTSGILQVACPRSKNWVISQGRDGIVKCWDLQGGGVLTSLPLQEFSSGCYNFCRFALLEAGQTSSSCSVDQRAAVSHSQPAVSPAQTVEGFNASQGTQLQADNQEATLHKTGHGRQSEPVQGLLSQQLQQENDLHSAQHTQICEQQQQQQVFVQQNRLDALVGHDTGHVAASASVDDLTEAAEEQLVLGTHGRVEGDVRASTATATLAGFDSSSKSSRGGCNPPEGPCFLALPSAEPADCGVWQLDSSAASGSRDAALLLLKQRTGADRPHRGQCMAVALLQPQGAPLHALTGYEDGSVALWDTRNCSSYIAAQKLHSEPVMCLAAAADCGSGLSGSADSTLAAFSINLAAGHLEAGPQQALPQQGLADVCIRPDGRIAATAGWDCKVRVWHCKRHQPLALLRWHSQQVACVGFSSNSQLLAAGGRDNCISMWSLYPPEG